MRCKRLLHTGTSTECWKGQRMTILAKWNMSTRSGISWTQWYKIQDMMMLLMINDQSLRHDTKWTIKITHWIHEGVYNLLNINPADGFRDPFGPHRSLNPFAMLKFSKLYKFIVKIEIFHYRSDTTKKDQFLFLMLFLCGHF